MAGDTTTISLERYAPDAKALVAGAQALADERGHAEVQPLHLLARGFAADPGVAEVMRRAVPAHLELKGAVERALTALPRSQEPAYLSATLLDLLERAHRESDRERAREVRVEHLLNALSQEIRGATGEILGAFGVGPGALRPHLAALHQVPRPSPGAVAPAEATRDLVSEARTGRADPVIGRDEETRRLLTILERRTKSHPLLVGEHGVGKGAIVRALAKRIARGDVPTTLVGVRLLELDTGALLAGAKLRGEVEQRVRRLIESVSRGKAGTETILVARGIDQLFGQGPTGSAVGDVLRAALSRGEIRLLGTVTPEGMRKLEERDPALLHEMTVLTVREPSVSEAQEVLRGIAERFEAHHGVRIGERAVVAAVTLAERYLQERFLPESALDLLDEASAWKRVETDGIPEAVDRTLRRLDDVQAQIRSMGRASDDDSLAVRTRLEAEALTLAPDAEAQRARLEARRGAVAAVRALHGESRSVEERLESARARGDHAVAAELQHVTQPDLAARLALAEEAARRNGAADDPLLDDADVARTLASWTGIPVAKMLEGEADKLLLMEERLSRRVVGQSAAVAAISRAVRRGRVGLRDPRRPIGSFLFLGPSGVGKTELAKAVAEFLFDDEDALTRLDMSEFMERHMAQRLLGAPPGYADSEQGGFLTEAVRRRPYSVLLFDEVEKAHQDVFNLLLQLLDDGRLTDGRGRLADFTSTVVILTSNIGSDRILAADTQLFERDEGRDALRDVLLDQLSEFFRPEFLNRVDDIVVFRPLGKDDLAAIADIQIAAINALLRDRNVRLELTEPAKGFLVDAGYEPALGARPLKRAIVKHLQDPVAERLLAGGLPADGVVRVERSGDALVLA